MTRSTNMEHVPHLQRMKNEAWRGSPEHAALDAAIASLSAPQPPAEAQAQGGGEVVAWAARNRSTGKFGYIWHTQDDVRGWIDLQHQSSDACTWTGPIPLYSTPAVQGFDAALQEIAESGDRCTSGDGHARCIDIATRALAAAAKGVGNG